MRLRKQLSNYEQREKYVVNILYFGTVCDLMSYEEILQNCKARPTVATIVFESALLEGFRNNGVDMSICSFPMIPTFPKSHLLRFGGKEELLPSGYTCQWLKTINLPFFKQLTRNTDAKRIIKKWAKKNGDSGVILTYSIPPFLVKTITKLSKKYDVKTVAIVPDLPHNMYINHKTNFLVKALRNLYLNGSLKYCDSYDGYVYLTKAMHDTIAPRKPHIVMEGILNESELHLTETCKASPRAIMYAGRLHEKYGVINLLKAFEMLENVDAELWFFGDGTAVEQIKAYSEKNSCIRYFGRVTREEILQYEKKATLLVNPRSVKDEFTKYSFPSKTIEYMYSGTPLLTTKLEGIPPEYFDYVFAVEDNEPRLLAQAMQNVLLLSAEALFEKGRAAQQFISDNKNATEQVRRIKNFLLDLLGKKYEIRKNSF